MKQRERQERSRQEILRAALQEFGAQDYDKVTVEGICGRHGISKGMMYHYYANKDELFLLCVDDTFQALKEHVERDAAALSEQNTFEAIQNYFMIREYFFQLHPERKRIFEEAMLHPPEHLRDQIQRLHIPIREMNRRFIEAVVSRMTLRPGLSKEKVTPYLEGIEYILRTVVLRYRGEKQIHTLHAMLETAQEVLDMVLFGIVRQPEEERAGYGVASGKGLEKEEEII